MQNNITTFDTNKLFPYTVGFDSLFDKLFDVDNETSSYPPYNISKSDNDNYIIEMALAGFNKNNIDIEISNGVLTIKSKSENNDQNKNTKKIYQGISQRSFVRKFTLSDEILVKNAEMKDGMLIISLERLIPDHKKPKSISIK